MHHELACKLLKLDGEHLGRAWCQRLFGVQTRTWDPPMDPKALGLQCSRARGQLNIESIASRLQWLCAEVSLPLHPCIAGGTSRGKHSRLQHSGKGSRTGCARVDSQSVLLFTTRFFLCVLIERVEVAQLGTRDKLHSLIANKRTGVALIHPKSPSLTGIGFTRHHHLPSLLNTEY